MAQVSRIDGIEFDGVWHEFEDSTAREAIAATSKKIYDNNDYLNDRINTEAERAKLAEKALEDSKITAIDGLGLSHNDLTDELKGLIEHPFELVGATSSKNGEAGIAPKPLIEDRDLFLKGDGTWAEPTDTQYDVATQEDDGLMSANDKLKLDTMDTENDELVSAKTEFEEINGVMTITEVLGNGKVKVVTFNADGSITLNVRKPKVEPITVTTVFNADGSITRTRS